MRVVTHFSAPRSLRGRNCGVRGLWRWVADGSMSLTASDAENWSCSAEAPSRQENSVVYGPVWTASSYASSQRPLNSLAWSGWPQKSPPTAVWINGSCQGANSEPPARDLHHSSQKFHNKLNLSNASLQLRSHHKLRSTSCTSSPAPTAPSDCQVVPLAQAPGHPPQSDVGP